MLQQFLIKLLKKTERLAYFLAAWSFLVLFLEPVVAFYIDYPLIENLTAIANILFLGVAIISRLMEKKELGKSKIIYADMAMLILGALLLLYQAKFVIFFLLIRQTYFILTYFIFNAFEGKFYKLLTSNPPVTLMLSFLSAIIAGTLLLMLPSASATGMVTSFIDALFTSTSATCVTGLVVVDTASHYSVFGQLVILLLIQLGGLGIMTVSTAFALVLGQRLTLKLENVMHSVVSESPSLDIFQLLKNIVFVTLIIEIAGAAVLFTSFVKVLEPLPAFYYSIFHSVSAFCNAGFALYPDSLVSYAGNLNINLSITLLIILGGLGFTVIIDLFRFVTSKSRNKRLSLHSKIVLSTTGVLLGLGMLCYFLAEYNVSMAGFTVPKRLLTSWFQSVTSRTAGFNTLDFGKMSSASILISLILMFIGASPGSTGGGIKTTTFAVLILSISSLLKGRKNLSIFNRKISLSNYREATSLITLAFILVVGVIFVLMLIEPFSFERISFEAISAFGTVGLSMGITSQLSYVGKLLIVMLMYVGRIGPLTIIYALSISRKHTSIEYAEEKIAIG